ncbi:cobalamin-dependent protein [Actinoplanes awajinensis]|uniref:B12-binding domain-containing protein n=1 Tax=Actinoplanes awajinensis subsp. mycoplanecinus TaxID=135947 RepID=A0A0X3V4S0_9ACTN|nr:cobalamin-dependent protein [Actinoplanes awajinensis]KUL39427.1 hypothetical protein ADL15_09745 [Actinoplanes awajinensis subsp. mycoplanecinus]
MELTVFERVVPLASGYLEAYAKADSYLAQSYSFDKYVVEVSLPRKKVIADLVAAAADVYALSCYVWNTGAMRKIATALREALPQAHIILGGPQVMHHPDRYLSTADPRTVLCNGEGEAIFAHYLRELLEPVPDMAKVPGISFPRDGVMVTNPQPPRISDLNTIPSPYLTGVFKPEYTMAILESNRGCPYHCGFCYWGAATNDRVYRFDEERVREEITWIARNDVFFVHIADANWGMLSRDIEFSQHIADCNREYGLPGAIYFSSAKNKPHAVTKIADIFQKAGVIAAQPISMQSMEPAVLQIVDRSNIKLSAFNEVQQDLKERGVSSFIELIWPLPGETVSSFKSGIGKLCDNEAQTIIAYPHLLLHNTPLYRDRDRLGLVTRADEQEAGESELVIGTQEVDYADFLEGMWFFYAVHSVQNTRGLRLVSRHLADAGVASHDEVLSAFVDHWRNATADDELVSFIRKSVDHLGFREFSNYGLTIHNVLHAQRALFGKHLRNFVQSQDWWSDEQSRILFDLDQLNRPYVYSNTPLDTPQLLSGTMKLIRQGRRQYVVEVADEWADLVISRVRLEPDAKQPGRLFVVDHKRMQMPFMSSQTLEHNSHYCHGVIEKIENIAPFWRVP